MKNPFSPQPDSTFYAAFGAFTPLPNRFVDNVMPFVSDTAWRLLCVVTRQTLGWKQSNSPEDCDERKTSDWLTHSQLIARTGRSSEAVSRALGDLVRAGLVEVHNEQGEPMLTAQARRRNGGRLYYRLSRNARKAADHIGKKARVEAPNPDSFSLERHRWNGTTKERENKELPDGSLLQEPSEVNPDVRRFLRAYRRRIPRVQALREVLGEAPLTWGRDATIVARLLKRFDYRTLVNQLENFLKVQIWRKGAVTLPAFSKWLSQPKAQHQSSERRIGVRHGRWMQAGRVKRRRF